MKNFILLEEACTRNNLPGPVIVMGQPQLHLDEMQHPVHVSCCEFSRSVAHNGQYPKASDIDELARLIFEDMSNSGKFRID